MNPFERLDFYKSNYTKSEKIIYEWIKKNPFIYDFFTFCIVTFIKI